MRQVTAILVLGMLWVGNVHAFWVPTPLEKLAESSTHIVIGKVTSLQEDAKSRRVVVELEILDLMKGKAEGQWLAFEAPFSLHPDVIIEPPPVHATSFRMGEVCAVFLKQGPKRLLMTKEDDGKLLVDWEKKQYRHGVMADNTWKPLATLREEIRQQVDSEDARTSRP